MRRGHRHATRGRVPAIFDLLAENGRVPREEMYQVFNMGIGMAAIVSAKRSREIARQLRAKPIGVIAAGTGQTRLTF